MTTWQAFETDAMELASFGRERIDRRVSFLGTCGRTVALACIR